jgi:hypothetical protein
VLCHLLARTHIYTGIRLRWRLESSQVGRSSLFCRTRLLMCGCSDVVAADTLIPVSRREEILVPTPGDGRRHHSTAPAARRGDKGSIRSRSGRRMGTQTLLRLRFASSLHASMTLGLDIPKIGPTRRLSTLAVQSAKKGFQSQREDTQLLRSGLVAPWELLWVYVTSVEQGVCRPVCIESCGAPIR